MEHKALKTVALIVTHPDDETLWAGGTLLNNPSWGVYVHFGREMIPTWYQDSFKHSIFWESREKWEISTTALI